MSRPSVYVQKGVSIGGLLSNAIWRAWHWYWYRRPVLYYVLCKERRVWIVREYVVGWPTSISCDGEVIDSIDAVNPVYHWFLLLEFRQWVEKQNVDVYIYMCVCKWWMNRYWSLKVNALKEMSVFLLCVSHFHREQISPLTRLCCCLHLWVHFRFHSW